MKKKYVRPLIEVEEIILGQMLAASFGSPEAASEDDVVGARDHRGAWGDLWGNE